ncbi:MAG: MurR/RpiR family transcriptional regulator [Rhodobacterales bacterium]|jgi:DNA-binding MurR/RpiR family transcriptional regulator|tara:strand:+ start:802 stop:1626 length:825 start_codon:yes stop_codon:yes gene_type:complete
MVKNMRTPGMDPTEYAELRALIVEKYPSLSPQHKEISEFSLSNPEIIAVETGAQLADRLNVQPSSLVRWAQALGFQGLRELKRRFRSQLVYQAVDSRDQAAANSDLGSIGLLYAVLDESAQDLALVRQKIDREHFREAADHLANAREIYVTAQHAAFAYATLFSWTLLRHHRQCHLLDNSGGFALRQSELAGPLDTTLAISFEPYQPSVVQAAKAHSERGGTVISITDSQLSPLARYSTILLEIPRRDQNAEHNFAAATCIVQSLALATCQSPS